MSPPPLLLPPPPLLLLPPPPESEEPLEELVPHASSEPANNDRRPSRKGKCMELKRILPSGPS
jgi:hypothetical protein